jgi:Cu2+-exporting ATPase/Cu+-exporting ATPase
MVSQSRAETGPGSGAGGQGEFSYLDQPEFRRQYGHPDNPDRMFFFIEGVHCTACLWRVESIRHEFDGIVEMRLDMGRHVVEIETEPGTQLAPVVARLKTRGYPPHPIPYDSLDTGSGALGHKNLLIRMGVAGAAAGNIMLLSTSLYSGAQHSEYAGIFEWLTFVLFLPILLFCASPFYHNSWAAIKNRHSSIDIPIVGAIVIGTGVGLHNLIAGRGDIYFDSLAVLVFLLLASRYLLFRLQHKFLAPNRLRSFYETDQVRVVDPSTGRAELRHIRRVRSGDRIVVYGGERIPVDGTLVSERAYVNAAVLTGEPYPRRVLENQSVFAGTQLTSDEAFIMVDKTGDDTRVGQLLRETERGVLGRTPLISLTDRAAQWFSASVLLVGLVFAVVYSLSSNNVFEAVNRGLALVILACPCALALATPLTQSLALRKAARRGSLIKKAEAFEKLNHVKTVFLDKTGTLTRGELDLERWWPQPPTDEERSIIYSLEKISRHPVARLLAADAARHPYRELELDGHEEIPGFGVRGYYKGDLYEVRSVRDTADLERSGAGVGGFTSAGLYHNGALVTLAVIGDRISESARDAVEVFGRHGRKVYLLTGDTAGAAAAVAGEVGIPPSNVLASRSPEQKNEVIREYGRSLMVGDGVNDSVALANAHVSVAVQGSMEVAFRAADVYLTRPGLGPLSSLFELSRTTIFIIKRNLLISLLYNAAGAALALMGYISPLVAAVLMPASSVTVVLLSIAGTRFWRAFDRDTEPAMPAAGLADGPVPSAAPGGNSP